MTTATAGLAQRKALDVLNRHRATFQQLLVVEEYLNRQFSEMSEAVYALMLSAASGEPLLFVGPPGTGKSMLIHTFCHLLGLYNLAAPDVEHADYFEYLLTPFTEPSELFGFYNIDRVLKHGEPLRRIDANMIGVAKVVYLDEVFNGSSAILNSILAFINERVVHDRNDRKRAAWQFFFAATNRVPDTPELAAVYDRFVLRSWVDNAPAVVEELTALLRVGWMQTYGSHPAFGLHQSLLGDLLALQNDVKGLAGGGGKAGGAGNLEPDFMTPDYVRTLAALVETARNRDLSLMSNRRLVKMLYILLVHRLYTAAKEQSQDVLLQPRDLAIVPKYFLDTRQDQESVELLAGRIAQARGRE